MYVLLSMEQMSPPPMTPRGLSSAPLENTPPPTIDSDEPPAAKKHQKGSRQNTRLTTQKRLLLNLMILISVAAGKALILRQNGLVHVVCPLMRVARQDSLFPAIQRRLLLAFGVAVSSPWNGFGVGSAYVVAFRHDELHSVVAFCLQALLLDQGAITPASPPDFVSCGHQLP